MYIAKTYTGVSTLAGSLALLASCSLLFSDSEVQSVPKCELPELAGTVAYFAMDEFEPVTHLMERESGKLILESFQYEDLGESAVYDLVPHPATIDGRCGNTLRFEHKAEKFLQLDHDALGVGVDVSVQSIDLWFRLSPPQERERRSLISKDRNSFNDGDLRIEIVPDRSSENYHLAARIQSDTSETELCSDVLRVGEWHHVAFSLGEEATLFLDGENMSGDTIQKSIAQESDFQGVSCGKKDVFGPRLRNSEDWIIGASNASGQEKPILHFFNGDIDEIRFLDRPFSALDAEQIRQFLTN